MLPEGWTEQSLDSLADYINGRAFKPEDWSKSGLPIIRIAQITNPNAEFDYYAGEDLNPRNLIENGDLIFSWSATLATIFWGKGKGILNQHLFKVIPNQGIDKGYLKQLIDHSIPALADHSHGSTMKHIKRSALKDFIVGVPPLPEQRRIAEILGSVDATIEATKTVIEQTKTVKQGLLQTLLTRGIGHTEFKDSPLGEVPEGWEVKTFDEVCSKITDGTHFSPPMSSEGFLYITSKNIRPLRMDLSNPVYVSEEEHNKIYPRCDVRRGDVLLTKDGANTGNCAINTIDEPFSMLSSVALIRADEAITSSDFICQFLNSPAGIEQTLGSMSGQAITRITLKKLKNFLIPAPPLGEQAVIVETLLSVDSVMDRESEKLLSLQTLKKGLMDDLLTGRIRVNQPEKVAA